MVEEDQEHLQEDNNNRFKMDDDVEDEAKNQF
jgi:hypothetical protein